MKKLNGIYKNIRLRIYLRWSHAITSVYFALNGVKRGKFVSFGRPLLDVQPEGECKLGAGLVMVNNAKFATLGKSNKCKFVVANGAKLILGDKVGMSNSTIVATLSVTIGNNIMIGGGVAIVDSDFHSMNPHHWHTDADLQHMRSAPVVIGDNVFIGMDSMILKGVTIGSNVIIAAGSVISKDVPDDQVWGGNPAQFIKNNIV